MSSLQCESATDSDLYCADEITSKLDCPVLPMKIYESDSYEECADSKFSISISNSSETVCPAETSAKAVVLEGANSEFQNGQGSDVLLKSGNGTSPVGGWGGDIQISAGNGDGSKLIQLYQ